MKLIDDCAAKRPGVRLRVALWTTALVITLPAAVANAGPRWMLVYYRQIGKYVNSNNHTIENHLFREDGTKGAGVGLTNLSNPTFPIFGYANADGWVRIDTDPNNFYYDTRVFQAGVPTDQSPNFYWENPPLNKYYTFETQWMYVSNDAAVVPYPTTPVYHYDLVNGINTSTVEEPPGFDSDAFGLSTWSTYQAQTFVVPAGINRIVSAQAFLTRTAGAHLRYRATIRQGGPSGTQIGPAVTSRDFVSAEFVPVLVCWALQDVPVIPGQTYALVLESTDGQGFNAYATNNNTYSQGILYNGTTPITSRDLLAMVVGVGYGANPPVIERSPAVIARSVTQGTNLPNDLFTIRNTGGGELQYSIGDNVNWLSLDPVSGTATTETDTITMNYFTAALPPGNYTATITITSTNATNTPQTITVNLTVNAAPIIEVSPTSLSIVGRLGRDAPAASFTIRNSGGGTMGYTVASNRTWMTPNPAVGSSDGETDTIAVAFDTDLIPIGTYTGQIQVNAPIATNTPVVIPVTLNVYYGPDIDTDGDVDVTDFGFLQICFNGPGRPYAFDGCDNADFDGDTDVDLTDFGKFLACFNGPNRPPASGCTP